MRKQYLYCLISVIAVLIGIIFTISGIVLQSNPLSRKSALLIVSIVLIFVGAAAFAVNYKKHRHVTGLREHKLVTIAHWTYTPSHSKVLIEFIKEQKNGSYATALFYLILACIFCMIYAYSGTSSVVYMGYFLLLLSIGTFILALRFITAYYEKLSENEVDIIFGEDSILFIDELFELRRGYHYLQRVTIRYGNENYLLFDYGLYDVDDTPAYTLTIPIPKNKLHTAEHIKTYYNDLIKPSEIQ